MVIRSLIKVLPKHHVIFVNNLILQNKCISFIFIHLLLTTNQNCLITHQNYLSSVGIKICSKDYFKNLFKILQPQDIRFHSQARFRSGIVGPSKSDEFGLWKVIIGQFENHKSYLFSFPGVSSRVMPRRIFNVEKSSASNCKIFLWQNGARG